MAQTCTNQHKCRVAVWKRSHHTGAAVDLPVQLQFRFGMLVGMVTLPWKLYLLGLGLILVPVLVMELSKAFGLIKHQH